MKLPTTKQRNQPNLPLIKRNGYSSSPCMGK